MLIQSRAECADLEVEEVEERDRIRWRLDDPGPNESANPVHLLAARGVLDSLEWDEIVANFDSQDPVGRAQDYVLQVHGEKSGMVLQEDGTWKHWRD